MFVVFEGKFDFFERWIPKETATCTIQPSSNVSQSEHRRFILESLSLDKTLGGQEGLNNSHYKLLKVWSVGIFYCITIIYSQTNCYKDI